MFDLLRFSNGALRVANGNGRGKMGVSARDLVV